MPTAGVIGGEQRRHGPLLVMGLDDDFNLRRLERYLALASASELAPVIVLTKVDAATPLRSSSAFVRRHAAASPPACRW